MKPQIYELLKESYTIHNIPVTTNTNFQEISLKGFKCITPTNDMSVDELFNKINNNLAFFYVIQLRLVETRQVYTVLEDNVIKSKIKINPSKTFRLVLGNFGDLITSTSNFKVRLFFDDKNPKNIYIKYKLYNRVQVILCKEVESILFNGHTLLHIDLHEFVTYDCDNWYSWMFDGEKELD